MDTRKRTPHFTGGLCAGHTAAINQIHGLLLRGGQSCCIKHFYKFSLGLCCRKPKSRLFSIIPHGWILPGLKEALVAVCKQICNRAVTKNKVFGFYAKKV